MKQRALPVQAQTNNRSLVQLMKTTLMKFGRRAIKSSVAPVRRLANCARQSSKESGRVIIVYYHRVVADIHAAEREAIFGLLNSTDSFRRQLQLLKNNCEFVTMDEAAQILRGEKKTARTAAAITFDDGYRDNYEQAFPVLREMGLPATIYVSSDFVNSQQPLHHDRIHWLVRCARQQNLDLRESLEGIGLRNIRIEELARERNLDKLVGEIVYLPYVVRERLIEKLEAKLGTKYPQGYAPLTWEMISEMQQAGIAFGGHTDRHPILTLEDSDTIEREIRSNRRTLENVLNQRVQHFAYPNGSYNTAIKNLVAKLGFASAVTTKRRVAVTGEDPHAIARVGMSEETTRGLLGRYSESVARMRLMVN